MELQSAFKKTQKCLRRQRKWFKRREFKMLLFRNKSLWGQQRQLNLWRASPNARSGCLSTVQMGTYSNESCSSHGQLRMWQRFTSGGDSITGKSAIWVRTIMNFSQSAKWTATCEGHKSNATWRYAGEEQKKKKHIFSWVNTSSYVKPTCRLLTAWSTDWEVWAMFT